MKRSTDSSAGRVTSAPVAMMTASVRVVVGVEGANSSSSRGSVPVQAASMPTSTTTAVRSPARRMGCMANSPFLFGGPGSAEQPVGDSRAIEAAEAAEGDDRDGDEGSQHGPDDPGPVAIKPGHQWGHAVQTGVDQRGQEDAAATPDERPREDHGVADEADDRRPPVEPGIHLAG